MLQTYTAQVTKKKVVAPDILQFSFKLIKPNSIEFKPGQYFLLQINDAVRHYSFSSSPNQKNEIETVVDISPMGIGSKYLASLTINDQVDFRAPLGQFFLQPNNKSKIFIATGTGMVPFKSMILFLVENRFSQPFKLVWGVRNRRDLYFNDIWQKLAHQSQYFNYYYCLSREKVERPHFFSGRIQNCLTQNLTSIAPNALNSYEFYLCGRPQTVEDLKQFLIQEIKIPEESIFFEKFT